MYDYNHILYAMAKQRYVIEQEQFRLNLVGIRSAKTYTGRFQCTLAGIRHNGDDWDVMQTKGTTLPGSYYLEHPLNDKGTAIMLPGQYLRMYRLGEFKGRRCFRQHGPAVYVRDNDHDRTPDFDLVARRFGGFSDVIGTHIHYMGEGNDRSIGRWSAGCQGPEEASWLDTMVQWGEDQINCSGTGLKSFNYTLLEERDL